VATRPLSIQIATKTTTAIQRFSAPSSYCSTPPEFLISMRQRRGDGASAAASASLFEDDEHHSPILGATLPRLVR